MRIFGAVVLRKKGPPGLQIAIDRVPYDPGKRNLVLCCDLSQYFVLFLRETDGGPDRALMGTVIMAFFLSPHDFFQTTMLSTILHHSGE